MNFIGSTASVSAYNKLRDCELGDINDHYYPCKHRESAKLRSWVEYIVFWNLFPPRYAQFDSASTFRYNLKNS